MTCRRYVSFCLGFWEKYLLREGKSRLKARKFDIFQRRNFAAEPTSSNAWGPRSSPSKSTIFCITTALLFSMNSFSSLQRHKLYRRVGCSLKKKCNARLIIKNKKPFYRLYFYLCYLRRSFIFALSSLPNSASVLYFHSY